MFDQTPYDDERRRYSRSALARLVLAWRARGLSETAAELVVTRYDRYCGAGGRVSEASSLAACADRVLTAAVVYERERGSSWDDIGRYLGVSGADAEQRFGPVIDEWQTAFDVPYRLDETGRKRIPQLPMAAYDPVRVSRDLDLWADVRLGFNDKHAVSGGLDEGETEPADDDEIHGLIRPSHLATFLNLLSYYAHHRQDDDPWAHLMAELEHSRNATPPVWHSYTIDGIFEPLRIRMAWESDGNRVSVVAVNVHSAELRLRISTLIDAFDVL